MPLPTRLDGAAVDLAPRLATSSVVVASPAAAAETIIAQITITQDLSVGAGILLVGFGAYIVGTNGVSINLRIRRTNVSGTIVAATGATTATAANLGALSVVGVDTGVATAGAVYCLTAILASASAPSTFSAVNLSALVI